MRIAVTVQQTASAARPRVGWAVSTAASSVPYLVVFGIAALLAFDLTWKAVEDGWLGFDFNGTLWDPAVASREGRAPYPAPVVSEVDVGNPALYPPLLFLLVTPLTFLPWSLGLAVWIAILGAAVAAALYLLGVRDVRCYVVALISVPTVEGLLWTNATLLLLPLVALAWRWRSEWLRAGAVVGLALAAKLFLWPLVAWLVGTRRYRAAGAALGFGTAALFLPWAVIGFSGLRSYPDLLRVAEDVYAAHSFSTATMLSALGAGGSVATAATLGLGAGGALAALIVGRSGRDELALFIALLAAVLGSPIVWTYYYALLLIPLAIARPRFSALWLLPLALYVTRILPRPRLQTSEFDPGGSACCRPEDVPFVSWVSNHSPPGLWPALGHAAVALLLVVVLALRFERTRATS